MCAKPPPSARYILRQHVIEAATKLAHDKGDMRGEGESDCIAEIRRRVADLERYEKEYPTPVDA